MNEEEPSYNECLTSCGECETKYFASESSADDYEKYCSTECESKAKEA